MTAAEPEFGENQFARQRPLAQGVKCHMSNDMARGGNGVVHQFAQQDAVVHWLFQRAGDILASESLRFRLVSVRLRKWNCSCSN